MQSPKSPKALLIGLKEKNDEIERKIRNLGKNNPESVSMQEELKQNINEMVEILRPEEQRAPKKPNHQSVYKLHIHSSPIETEGFRSSQGPSDKASIAKTEAMAHAGNKAIIMSHAKGREKQQAIEKGLATGSTYMVDTYRVDEREFYIHRLDELGGWKTEKIVNPPSWLYTLFNSQKFKKRASPPGMEDPMEIDITAGAFTTVTATAPLNDPEMTEVKNGINALLQVKHILPDSDEATIVQMRLVLNQAKIDANSVLPPDKQYKDVVVAASRPTLVTTEEGPGPGGPRHDYRTQNQIIAEQKASRLSRVESMKNLLRDSLSRSPSSRDVPDQSTSSPSTSPTGEQKPASTHGRSSHAKSPSRRRSGKVTPIDTETSDASDLDNVTTPTPVASPPGRSPRAKNPHGKFSGSARMTPIKPDEVSDVVNITTATQSTKKPETPK